MKLTIDTAGATAFELNVMSRALAEIAAQVRPAVNGNPSDRLAEAAAQVEKYSQTAAPVEAAELGNAVSTAIPAAPASATASESPSSVPAAPSGTPAATASAVPAAPSDQKLDSAGFPWDARINTANKGTVGDGSWRKKPGVAPELVEQVRAELSAGKAPAVPAVPNAAATGAIPAAPAADTAPVVPTLTSQDVLARCTEIQMSDMSKGSALFQAIVAAGVAGGPMALPSVTDPAVLAACLAAVNAVGAA